MANQRQLMNFDTQSFNDINDIRGTGLSALLGGDQSALDSALELRKAGVQRRFDEQDVIWAPAQTLDDVIIDPQVRANDYFTTVDHPTHGPYETVQTPLKFSRSDVGVRGAAPEVGQQTEEVLLETGFTWDEIAGLRASGALG